MAQSSSQKLKPLFIAIGVIAVIVGNHWCAAHCPGDKRLIDERAYPSQKQANEKGVACDPFFIGYLTSHRAQVFQVICD